jgi:nucleoid-associated protein YgaU
LQQYAESGGYEERFAFLVGRYMVIDSQTVLFISGVVQGKHMTVDKDVTLFSDKSWQHAKNEIRRYFNGLDIVGGAQSQPGYGVNMNSAYAEAFKKTFTREDQVFFVIDPVEKLNSFFVYDEKQENLLESQGYFIYYDKNRGMHEYMLDNKLTNVSVRPIAEVEDAAKPRTEEAPARTARRRLTSTPAYRTLVTSVGASKNMSSGQKRIVNLLVSLSAVLFIVSFIMGAGLIQNDGRISVMENQLTQLNTAYRDLLLQTRGEQNAEDVFADSAESALEAEDDGERSAIVEDGQQLAETADDEPEGEAVGEPVSVVPTISEPVYIPDTYVVQSGDTLSYISRMFYGDSSMVPEIMELNSLDNPDMIYFGKVLLLPK